MKKMGASTFSHGVVRLAEKFVADWKEHRREDPANWPAHMTAEEWWDQWQAWLDMQPEGSEWRAV